MRRRKPKKTRKCASFVAGEPWKIEPQRGLGPIRFGATRETLKGLSLGPSSGAGESRLSFAEGKLQLSFSSDGRLNHIGFAPDFEQLVTWEGQVLNGRAWLDVIELFAPAVFVDDQNDSTISFCRDLSISLWRRFDPDEIRAEIKDLEAEGADPEEIASLREDAKSASYPEEIALAIPGYFEA